VGEVPTLNGTAIGGRQTEEPLAKLRNGVAI
jgi:hypothetical protein